MKPFDITLKNLSRKKARSLFVLAVLAVGVAACISVLSLTDSMKRSLGERMEKYGANILVLPGTDDLSLSYGGIDLGTVSFDMKEIIRGDLERIKEIKYSGNIAAVGPLLIGKVKAMGKKVLLAGVDFTAFKVLRPWWEIEGMEPEKGDIIAGAKAADLLAFTQGEYSVVNGKKHKIAGVLKESGSQDDNILFTDLESAQAVLNKKGKISMAEVAALCNACPVSEMVSQIQEKLPGLKVTAIQQVVKGRMDSLALIKQFSVIIVGMMIVISGLVVFTTMMNSVRERYSEIGIFRAVGFRKGTVLWIILSEAVMISVAAGVIGLIAGWGISITVLPAVTGFSGAVLMGPGIALGAVAGSAIVGISAGIYPALAATALDPVEALSTL